MTGGYEYEWAVAGIGLVLVGAWVGHACVWTYLLNNAYGRPISKQFLKPFRLFVGVVIAAAPLIFLSAFRGDFANDDWELVNGLWGRAVLGYSVLCAVIGLVAFPAVTLARLLRRTPAAVLAEGTRTLDLWPEYGRRLVGDGKYPLATRLPFTCAFKVDFTDLTLTVRDLPSAWDGLTIDLLSDFHFHGTPSAVYFERVVKEVTARPPADVVVLAGDFLDTDTHHDWIPKLLGPLRWKEHGLAVLGNHDLHDRHAPDKTRDELAKLGYRVLADRWEEVTIRGVPCVVSGHEGPWSGGRPDLAAAPADQFHLCVSHSPDNFYWGVAHRVNLMLCGHVHGGQIRIPVIGSIFVPSVYSRRFDMGVFERGGTVMVAGRGLSGKEPSRLSGMVILPRRHVLRCPRRNPDAAVCCPSRVRLLRLPGRPAARSAGRRTGRGPGAAQRLPGHRRRLQR